MSGNNTEVSKVELSEFEEKRVQANTIEDDNFHEEIRRIVDVKVTIAANLGDKKIPIDEINQLKVGSVIEVDRIPGHLMEIVIGDEPVALGEIIPMENKFGLVISEVLGGKKDILKKVNRNGEVD